MDNQNNNQENVGKEAKKVIATYDDVIKKVTAIVQGPAGLTIPKKTKLKGEDFDIVADLFKEENEALRVEVKEGLKTLLKNKIILDRTIVEEEKKLEALKVAKKKEFNKAATELLNKIDGLGELMSSYQGVFNEAATAATTSEEESEEE